MEIKFLMMEKIKEDEMFPFLLFPSAKLHFHLKIRQSSHNSTQKWMKLRKFKGEENAHFPVNFSILFLKFQRNSRKIKRNFRFWDEDKWEITEGMIEQLIENFYV